MSILNKFLLIVLLSSIPSICSACGWNFEEEHFYYHLFDHTNIETENYYHFFKGSTQIENAFEDYHKRKNSANIKLWQELLPDWSLSDLSTVVYNDTTSVFYDSWKNRDSEIEERAKQYLEFARECGNAFIYRDHYSWKYSELNKTERSVEHYEDLLVYGNQQYQAETNQQLKKRYAYQIIRILHYRKKYQQAIDFFYDFVDVLDEKDELYYYCLDQVAGCYYSLEDYEKAAYLFLKVFENSKDRIKSAFSSYRFCTSKEAEGKYYFKEKDKSTYLFMQSLRGFSDSYEGMHSLNNLEEGSSRVAILYLKELEDIEKLLLPKWLGLKKNKGIPMKDTKKSERALELFDFAYNLSNKPDIENKAFWQISSAYLAFLINDLSLAKELLAKVKDGHFIDRKKSLENLFTVFGWKIIEENEEAFLLPYLDTLLYSTNKITEFWDYEVGSTIKTIILDQAAHLYYKNGQLAKAFLLHNSLEKLIRTSSLPLLDDLIALEAKEKSPFEQILINNAIKPNTKLWYYNTDFSVSDFLQYAKGVYFLQTGDSAKAQELLSTSKLGTDYRMYYYGSEYYYEDEQNSKEEEFEGIPNDIFSNNVIECFGCPMDYVMEDEVYLASVFEFIPKFMSHSDLSSTLLKLDTLTNDPTEWKRKVAHYLLGNYYFNVSNTGYFKGILNESMGNCCDYHYLGARWDTMKLVFASDLINEGVGYNLQSIHNWRKMYHRLADKAYEHYDQVIQISKDDELNARCLYMMAKCELNDYYNNNSISYGGYDGVVDSISQNYKKSFQKLKEEYGHTEFKERILMRCSFYRYYCSL